MKKRKTKFNAAALTPKQLGRKLRHEVYKVRPDVGKMSELINQGALLDGTDRMSGRTILMNAIMNHPDAIAKILIDAGALPDERSDDGATALILAARAARIEIVAALLDKGADMSLKDNDGETALDHAREAAGAGTRRQREKCPAVVQLLLAAEEKRRLPSSPSPATRERKGPTRSVGRRGIVPD